MSTAEKKLQRMRRKSEKPWAKFKGAHLPGKLARRKQVGIKTQQNDLFERFNTHKVKWLLTHLLPCADEIFHVHICEVRM